MCLTYTGFAVLSKQTRAAMLENFNADYVRTAKAKGVSAKDVIFRHVFRNSLLPLITIFVTIFPAMLAGSVVVERIFSVRGMGWLVIEAITLRDRELILANTVIIACVNLFALLLADLLYALADPRVSYE
jgi:ABC-type dipeptide/oligopeptide/nickel transport system permease component